MVRKIQRIREKLGLVHVYTGTGKGKTTMSLGIAFRALGYGLSVCIIQFMKGPIITGELKLRRKFPTRLRVRSYGTRCTSHEPDVTCPNCFVEKEGDMREAKRAFAYAKGVLESGKFDVVILDEINVAVAMRLIKLEQVARLVKNKMPCTELVLTGRGAPKTLIDLADVVTEMREIKHPFADGVVARKGIDY
ncbi:MAG: cob(I)yrinic acid a,c-diamide adenosyltransferase [archaeon]